MHTYKHAIYTKFGCAQPEQIFSVSLHFIDSTKKVCHSDTRRIWHYIYQAVVFFGFGYILPLSFMGLCYIIVWRVVSNRKMIGANSEHSNTKTLAAKMNSRVKTRVTIIMILYAVSWAPLVVFQMIFAHWPDLLKNKGKCEFYFPSAILVNVYFEYFFLQF